MKLKRLGLAAAVLFCVAAAVFLVETWRSRGGSGADLPVFGQVHALALTERDGSQVSFARLKGKIWIADFFFTSCPGPCPLMNAKMRSLQTSFADAPDVRLVSITVDPATDTPKVLTEYAARYGADKNRWLFLTGPRERIVKLAQDVFHLAAGDQPELHTTRFILVDQRGAVRGYFDSRNPDEVAKLKADVQALRARG